LLKQLEIPVCILLQKERCVYVDDIVLAARGSKRMANAKQELARAFKKISSKRFGSIALLLGQDDNIRNVWVDQQQYTENILRKFCKDDCKATRTLVDTSIKLIKVVDSNNHPS